MIVVPVNPTPLPTPPSTSDPVNFDPRADAFLGGLPNFQVQNNALAAATYQNALESQTQATNASNSAVSAAQSAAGAQATANYKGEWSTLTGALNPPATVSHQGRLWYLKQAVANVATQQPVLGSTYWGEVGSNQFITYVAPAGNTNAVDQGLYVMTTATSVLVLPASPADGMIIAAVNTSGTLTPTINRNGKSILGEADNFLMNVLNFQIVLQYFAAQNNWVQVMGVTAYTSAQPAINSANTFTAPQNFTGGLNMNGNPVVARGSNSDGEYVRYADGTQICWKIQTVNTTITNSDGGAVLYSAAVNLGSYPVAFSAAPSVTMSVSAGVGGAGAFLTSSTISQTPLIWGSYFLASGASRAAANYYISCVAVGRWF